MQTEVELTLSLSADQQAIFTTRVAQLFPDAKATPVQDLLGIYYDTPLLDLARRGMGLRLRKQSCDWVQCIKFTSAETTEDNSNANLHPANSVPTASGLHTRAEIEHTTATQVLELHRITHQATRDFLMDARIASFLRPVFETHIQRTQWQISSSDNLVELSLDIGTITRRTVAVSEIEIELKHGSADALFAVAQILQQEFALSPQVQSKAERGYRLL